MTARPVLQFPAARYGALFERYWGLLPHVIQGTEDETQWLSVCLEEAEKISIGLEGQHQDAAQFRQDAVALARTYNEILARGVIAGAGGGAGVGGFAALPGQMAQLLTAVQGLRADVNKTQNLLRLQNNPAQAVLLPITNAAGALPPHPIPSVPALNSLPLPALVQNLGHYDLPLPPANATAAQRRAQARATLTDFLRGM